MPVPKPIYSITPFTLLDYPDKTACIVWFAGCTMRCVYCYNPEIVFGEGKLSTEEVLQFLKSRRGLLDAVVLSGGESTRYNGIIQFANQLKQLGMLVKLDTNGSCPDVVKHLLQNQLVDYVALDFKSLPNDYYEITGSKLFERFEKTFEVLLDSTVAFEIRTTVHADLINQDALNKMIQYAYFKGYKGNYYVQHFVNHKSTIGSMEEHNQKYLSMKNLVNSDQVIFRN